MRGYLQRLVSTANGAESSVRPLVKSMFSPSASVSPESLVPSVLGDDVAPYRSDPTAVADYHARSEEPAVADPFDDTVREAPSRRRLAHVNDFEPLLPIEIAKPAIVEASAARHGEQFPQADDLSMHDSLAAAAEQARARNSKISDYVPLLDARRTAPLHEPIASEMQPHTQTRLPQQESGQRSIPIPSTAPDEIHIHIGRIEVTAIPPAIKAMPQKPANNGPSLQEYLKRRDRRLQ